jgi:hypothetical protein
VLADNTLLPKATLYVLVPILLPTVIPLTVMSVGLGFVTAVDAG